ncbi:hypothetical protein CEQ28_022175 [Hafnia alvei]|nr:hypothetical protein CEQ28_022175 [Hafnia alvei]
MTPIPDGADGANKLLSDTAPFTKETPPGAASSFKTSAAEPLEGVVAIGFPLASNDKTLFALDATSGIGDISVSLTLIVFETAAAAVAADSDADKALC